MHINKKNTIWFEPHGITCGCYGPPRMIFCTEIDTKTENYVWYGDLQYRDRWKSSKAFSTFSI